MRRPASSGGPARAVQARRGLLALAVFTAVLWAVQVANLATGRVLNSMFGNIPRRLEGLDGILFSPLLHADFTHLASNSLPLIVLGFLVFLEGPRRFATVVA
ncbi:rhomboid family intramembrane serine protease, partial [Arthrobacter deserti]|nr:rhomboid family intramembrane serine protease [Arthrobacter deserti]